MTMGFARRAAKALLAAVLRYSGAQPILARASRRASGGRRVLVVAYHRVVEDFEREAQRCIPGLLLARSTFDRHLDEIHRAGFDIVPLAQALEVIAGRLEPKRDVAVLTFDDGYRDVYDHAFPLLRRRGLPATLYLATGFVGTQERFPHDRLFHLIQLARRLERGRRGRNVVAIGALGEGAAAEVERQISLKPAGELLQLIGRLEAALGGAGELKPLSGEVLDWAMVRAMAGAGFEIGAHTVHHAVLTHESQEGIDLEICGSKRAIEEQVGRPVRSFAYPNGFYDERVVASLVRHGFATAVTTEDVPNRAGANPFEIKRKTLWENFSRGPFGYSSALMGCHLDDLFTLLASARGAGTRWRLDEAAGDDRFSLPSGRGSRRRAGAVDGRDEAAQGFKAPSR